MATATGTITREFAKVIADTLNNDEGSWGNYTAGLSLNRLSPGDTMATVAELTDSLPLSDGYARKTISGSWTIADALATYDPFDPEWENLTDPEEEFPNWETAQSLFVAVTVGGVERLAWYVHIGSVTLEPGDEITFSNGLKFELDSA